MIGKFLYLLGLASIPLSVAIYSRGDTDLGIFVGLWVPTLLLLSKRCVAYPAVITTCGYDEVSHDKWKKKG